jgi:hypothetical protein
MGACAVHAHANGKPYRAIVMCPPHLVEIWRQQELSAIFHDDEVGIKVLQSWDELIHWPRTRPLRPTWLIMGETKAKNGPRWKPAFVKNYRGLPCCPTCGGVLRDKNGNYLTNADLKRSRKFCTIEVPTRLIDEDGLPIIKQCGAPLWQYDNEDDCWAPANYIHQHMDGVFDYAIFDELHQEKSATSARANALGAIAASVKKVLGMTGTLIGGRAGHIRPLLFRLAPRSLKAEGLTWSDDMEFARRYGRVDTITKECSGPDYDNKRSRGKAESKRQVEQPGIMPTLYGRHLIGNTIFLSLEDITKDLPPYTEHLTAVKMSGDMEIAYEKMESELKDAITELLRKGNCQLLSTMLHALLAYPDFPYGWKPLGYYDKKDGDRFVHVTTPPTLNRTKLWPKEKKLLEILSEEKALGRQCWVFAVYTDSHPVLGRLEEIIRNAGFTCKVLDSDKVQAKTRAAWIAKNAPGVDVIISHPQPVGTGMTLFSPNGSHNFCSLVFYETGYDLFALRQASRRSWRIGQKEPCRTYYLYYEATMQARAMALMAKKLDASLALEGQFSADGLAALSDDSGSMAMELAKSLVDNIPFGDTERIWTRAASPEIEPEPEEPPPYVDETDDELVAFCEKQLALF